MVLMKTRRERQRETAAETQDAGKAERQQDFKHSPGASAKAWVGRQCLRDVEEREMGSHSLQVPTIPNPGWLPASF